MAQTNNPPDILNSTPTRATPRTGCSTPPTRCSRPATASRPASTRSSTQRYLQRGRSTASRPVERPRAVLQQGPVQQAGIAAPPKTWDEFETDAKKITALGDGDVGYAEPLGPEEAQAEFAIWVFNNGGDWKTNGKWSDQLPAEHRDADSSSRTSRSRTRSRRTTPARPTAPTARSRCSRPARPAWSSASRRCRASSTRTAQGPVRDRADADARTADAEHVWPSTDYLMAFKQRGQRRRRQEVLELYYSAGQRQHLDQVRGLPAGDQVRAAGVLLGPASSRRTSTRCRTPSSPRPTTRHGTRVETAVKQNIGAAVEPNGDPKKRARPARRPRRRPAADVAAGRAAGACAARVRPGGPAADGALVGPVASGARPRLGGTAVAGACLVLIGGVVIFPAIVLVRASMSALLLTGRAAGSAGGANSAGCSHAPGSPARHAEHRVWVASVVVITIVSALGLPSSCRRSSSAGGWCAGRSSCRGQRRWSSPASCSHPLRRLVRVAEPAVHLAAHQQQADRLPRRRQVDPAVDDRGRHVRVPAVHRLCVPRRPERHPERCHTRRRGSTGPGRGRRTGPITLPLLRPALLVAAVLNMIYVFNSFPIIYTLNDRKGGVRSTTRRSHHATS